MTADIWSECAASAKPALLEGAVLRLVESQEQVATNALVRTLAEQALLEDMLEGTKPPLPTAAAGLHYLLATPFRYPPLRYGSRFGRRTEPSLFYGSRAVRTLLAEGAYYRLVFWSGMETPPSRELNTRHSVFSAAIHAANGLRLQDPPFDGFSRELTDRTSYGATQALGSAMRDADIDAFEFTSARDTEAGINVAMFTPAALASDRPVSVTEWLCQTRADLVTYYCRETMDLRQFPLAEFLVDDALPVPAT